MAITHVDIDMIGGQKNVYDLTLTDENAAAVDLTTASAFTYEVRESEFSTDTLVSKSLGSGIAIQSPATNGIVRLTIDDTDTATIPTGTYYHEAFVTLATGKFRVLRGEVNFEGKLGAT